MWWYDWPAGMTLTIAMSNRCYRSQPASPTLFTRMLYGMIEEVIDAHVRFQHPDGTKV